MDRVRFYTSNSRKGANKVAVAACYLDTTKNPPVTVVVAGFESVRLAADLCQLDSSHISTSLTGRLNSRGSAQMFSGTLVAEGKSHPVFWVKWKDAWTV